MFDVVGIGVPCVDLLINVDYLPKSDESLRMNDFSWQGGGKVPTAMVALARLGSNVGMVASVGNDAPGHFIIDDFKRHGVDTEGIIIRNEGRSSFSVVISDKKNNGRSIIYKPGNLCNLKLNEIDKNYIFNTRMIHISGSTDIDLELVKACRNKNIDVTIDADSYKDSIIELIPYVNYFIASEDFVSSYSNESFEKTAANISKQGPEVVIITLGAKGCVSYENGSFEHHSAYKVKIKDTTGAGDVFHGAFIHALLKDWSLKYCCQFANAVSAIKCTRMGGRAAIPDFNEVQYYLNEGKIKLKNADNFLEKYKKFPGERN